MTRIKEEIYVELIKLVDEKKLSASLTDTNIDIYIVEDDANIRTLENFKLTTKLANEFNSKNVFKSEKYFTREVNIYWVYLRDLKSMPSIISPFKKIFFDVDKELNIKLEWIIEFNNLNDWCIKFIDSDHDYIVGVYDYEHGCIAIETLGYHNSLGYSEPYTYRTVVSRSSFDSILRLGDLAEVEILNMDATN